MAAPGIRWFCGGVGLAGALAAIPADVVSWLLAQGYSPIRQTISALAVGPSSWLIDFGLLAYALACVAVGTGMRELRLPGRPWTLGSLAIVGAGLAVAVVSFANQYAGQQNAGANIHAWMVYALYALFGAAALAAAPGLGRLDARAARWSRLIGAAWIALGPIYYVWFPAGWAGAFERGLALLMILWLVLVARLLREEGRQAARPV